MPKREYTGDALDVSYQDIKDRPYKGRGETVDVTPDESGSVHTEGVEDVFGPSENAKRAYELINSYQQLPDDELLRIAVDFLKENEEEYRGLAALHTLIERSGQREGVYHYIDEHNDGNVGVDTVVDIIGHAISNAVE